MQYKGVCVRQAALVNSARQKLSTVVNSSNSSEFPLLEPSAAFDRLLQQLFIRSHASSCPAFLMHCMPATVSLHSAGCVTKQAHHQSRRMLQHSLLCTNSCIDYSMANASSASSPDCRASFLQGNGLEQQQQRQYDAACLVQKTSASPDAEQMSGGSVKDGDLAYQHKVSNIRAVAEICRQPLQNS
jgi:hypothetical protein